MALGSGLTGHPQPGDEHLPFQDVPDLVSLPPRRVLTLYFIDYYYFMVRTLKIYPPSRFLAHNTALLTIGIVLYSRSLKLFILHN